MKYNLKNLLHANLAIKIHSEKKTGHLIFTLMLINVRERKSWEMYLVESWELRVESYDMHINNVAILND